MSTFPSPVSWPRSTVGATMTPRTGSTGQVFHQPNTKFPIRVARMLGFTQAQYEAGLLAPKIGNVYAGSSLLGLTALLDVARPGQRIMLVSFGSGAGSDAFSWVVTEHLTPERKRLAPATATYIARRQEVDYATYARFRDKLVMS